MAPPSSRRALYLLAMAALVAAGVSASAFAATSKRAPKLAVKPGTYSGTVTMSPVHPDPNSSTTITLTGTWSLTFDKHDRVHGTETLSGAAPIDVSSGCSATPAQYTLGFTAIFGKSGFGVSGGPGVVQGRSVTINIDSQTGSGAATDQGWSSSPGTYRLICGNDTFNDEINFFGELGVPVVTYLLHLPLSLFQAVGHSYSAQVENVENTKFAQTFTLHRK